MPRYSLHPDRLFDRPWRAGHPFRPKAGRFRRVGMIVLLLLLCTVIFGYGYITDSERVRRMAENYLSTLIGGRVKIGAATLSIFEGLRLDDVTVYVDPDPNSAADSELFSARAFILRYEPRSMLRGQLEATQIIAEKPHVHLTQDVRTGAWNFHRLGQNLRPTVTPRSMEPRPLPLPEVLLRSARVEIGELRDRRMTSLGYVAIDGQLTPGAAGTQYDFVLQTRSVTDAMGAFVTGSAQLNDGHIVAQLKDFVLNRDMRSILPESIRDWCSRHELSGRVDIPLFDYTPPRDGAPPRFKVQTILNDVNLAAPPEEWMSGEEIRRREDIRGAWGILRNAFEFAGCPQYRRPEPIAGASGEAVRAMPRSAVDLATDTLSSTPIRLHQVSGAFVFDESGIDVNDLRATLDANSFSVSGRFAGYDPDATMFLRMTSLEGTEIQIPPAPPYLWSLPREVRDFYHDIRPQGTCRLELNLGRNRVAGPIQVDGAVNLLDGSFVYKEFKYPLAHVNGTVRFGRDPYNGFDWVRISKLRASGIQGSVNENAVITVDGWIGPVGPGHQEPGMDIHARGDNFRSERALFGAFDPDVQEGLSILDAPGEGHFPQFRGSFSTHLLRRMGPKQRVSFDTDIDLVDGSAILEDFPYPLRQISGKLKICDGYLDVAGITMKRGDATMTANGRVAWATEADVKAGKAATPGGKPPRTDLGITVRELPFDDDLIAALPPNRIDWVRKLGVGGKVDVDGRLFSLNLPARIPTPKPASTAPSTRPVRLKPPTTRPVTPLGYNFAINLHGGTMRPLDGDLLISDVDAKINLGPDRIDLSEFRGRRGKAELTAGGHLAWPTARPHLEFHGSAKELRLEPALHALLPEESRRAWDEVQPEGTIDADMTYNGFVGDGPAAPSEFVSIDLTHAGSPLVHGPVAALPGADPTTQPTTSTALVPPGLSTTIRPRDLSVTVRTIPYRLDHLKGSVGVTPDVVTVNDFSGRHGDAKFWFSGSGTTGTRPVWQLQVKVDDLAPDEDLRKALPDTAATFFNSLKLKGKLNVALSKLVFRAGETPAVAEATDTPIAAASHPTTAPASPPDVDLAGTITVTGGSMESGATMTDVNGAVAFAAAVRAGKLEAMRGDADVATFTLAGRTVQGFRATLGKPAGKNELLLDEMQGRICGGDVAGQLRYAYPDAAGANYALSLAVRNVDVRQLTGDADPNLSGRLTASLALEGSWDKPNVRRGRGDVVVSGKDMYKLPLVVGLVQVTNLAMPISSPFKTATARYNVDGQKLTFQKIELRSDNLLMTGDGNLDFGTKQVRMTFVTDNPGAFKIPLVQDFWRSAQHELLRIHVNGTVQDPKVAASTMGTITTTVDEIFKADTPKRPTKKK